VDGSALTTCLSLMRALPASADGVESDRTGATEQMKKRPLYVVNALLASGVLCFALDRSRGDRGPVDWTVLSLIGLAILWNLLQLTRRLHRARGMGGAWRVPRTLLFWGIGLMNTPVLRPETLGGWRPWVGGAFLVLAGLDTAWVARDEWRLRQAEASSGG